MSDITMIFGLYFVLGLGLAGLLVTWWLLFPGRVAAAHARIARTPVRTFLMGLVGLAGWTVPIFILFALPGGPAQLLGAVVLTLALSFATLGAAGIASVMAERLALRSGPGLSGAAAYLRGVAALELAAAIPALGWFVVVPIALIFSMGAAVFAILHWVPKENSSDRSDRSDWSNSSKSSDSRHPHDSFPQTENPSALKTPSP